jgi:hypothetical protein
MRKQVSHTCKTKVKLYFFIILALGLYIGDGKVRDSEVSGRKQFPTLICSYINLIAAFSPLQL